MSAKENIYINDIVMEFLNLQTSATGMSFFDVWISQQQITTTPAFKFRMYDDMPGGLGYERTQKDN